MPTHHQGPPDDVRALDTFIKLVRASGSVLARTGRHLAAEGLTVGQFGILETLLHLGPLHQCELARKHLQSGGNVTMIVDNLEKAGLVRRERLAADRRYVRVCLTPAGKARITRFFPNTFVRSANRWTCSPPPNSTISADSAASSACTPPSIPKTHRCEGRASGMSKIFGPIPAGRAAVGLLLVRLVFGVGIILHGWDKVANGGPFHWADGFGPPLSDIPPGFQALATFTELGTGVAMILGLFTPLAMLGLAATMAVALVQGHRGEPYVSLERPYKPTYEPVAHYGVLALGVAPDGTGRTVVGLPRFRAAEGDGPAGGALTRNAPMSAATLFAGLIFGAAGMGAFVYGGNNGGRRRSSLAWR